MTLPEFIANYWHICSLAIALVTSWAALTFKTNQHAEDIKELKSSMGVLVTKMQEISRSVENRQGEILVQLSQIQTDIVWIKNSIIKKQ